MLKKPGWVLDSFHWEACRLSPTLANTFAFVRCRETELQAVKQSRPLCHSQPEQEDQPHVNSSADSSSHGRARRHPHRTRAKMWSKTGAEFWTSLFCFFSGVQGEEEEKKKKKNQKDCRQESNKTREDKWMESSWGQARNWKKKIQTLYIFIWQLHTRSRKPQSALILCPYQTLNVHRGVLQEEVVLQCSPLSLRRCQNLRDVPYRSSQDLFSPSQRTWDEIGDCS